MPDPPTKGMTHKIFDSTDQCWSWYEKAAKEADYDWQRGMYYLKCQNAKRYEQADRVIKVTFDEDGMMDRFQVVERTNTNEVLFEP